MTPISTRFRLTLHVFDPEEGEHMAQQVLHPGFSDEAEARTYRNEHNLRYIQEYNRALDTAHQMGWVTEQFLTANLFMGDPTSEQGIRLFIERKGARLSYYTYEKV